MKLNKLCDFRFFTFRKYVSQIMCDFDIAFFSTFFLCEKVLFLCKNKIKLNNFDNFNLSQVHIW